MTKKPDDYERYLEATWGGGDSHEPALRKFLRDVRAESFADGVIYGLEFCVDRVNNELKLWRKVKAKEAANQW